MSSPILNNVPTKKRQYEFEHRVREKLTVNDSSYNRPYPNTPAAIPTTPVPEPRSITRFPVQYVVSSVEIWDWE